MSCVDSQTQLDKGIFSHFSHLADALIPSIYRVKVWEIVNGGPKYTLQHTLFEETL